MVRHILQRLLRGAKGICMKKEEWKSIVHRSLTMFVSLAMAILLVFVIWRFGEIRAGFRWVMEILTPFIYGGVMAYLLKTPCNFLEQQLERILPKKNRRFARPLAVVLVLALAFLVIYVLLSMVLPEVAGSIYTLVNTVPEQIERLASWITQQLDGNEVLQTYVNTAFVEIEKKLKDWMSGDLIPTVQAIMNGFATTVGSVVGVLANVGIGMIICIYLLAGRKTFARQGKAVLYAVLKEEYADWILEELTFVDRTFVGFFAGKILDSAIVGLICYAFCLLMSFITDFPNAVLISMIIGVTNIIPYFGPFIGAIPSALLIFISSPINCVFFVIFIIILQQFDGNILGPRLLANSVGLTGIWVLFSITLFQGLFGFAGILIGVPSFAVIYDLIRRLVKRGLANKGKSYLLEGETCVQNQEQKQEFPS